MQLTRGVVSTSIAAKWTARQKAGVSLCATLLLISGAMIFSGSAYHTQAMPVSGESRETDADTNPSQTNFPEPRLALPLQEAIEAQKRASTEYRWLRSQPREYQQAIAIGELPEGETGQRQVGLLIRGLRAHFGHDQSVARFLLSTEALPWLVELRFALGRYFEAAEDELDVQMVLSSVVVQTNSGAQRLLKEIEAHAEKTGTE